MLRHLLAIFVILISSPFAWAESVEPATSPLRAASLSNTSQFPYSIIEYAKYFEDASHRLTIEDVRNPSQAWINNQSQTINFGLTRTPAWIHFKLDTIELPNEKIYLNVPFPVIDLIDVFIFQGNELMTEVHTGDLLPFDQRPVSHRNFLIPLDLQSNKSYEIYARFYVDGSLQLEASIIPADILWKKTQANNIIEDMYYGILFAMIAYNLFFFFATREISYVYYSSYVMCFALFNATLRGYGYQFLWPNSPEWNGAAIPITIFSCIGFMSFFSAHFLSLDNRLPWVYSFFKTCGSTAFILIITTPFLPKIASILLGGVLVIPVCGVALFVSWYLLLKGSVAAKYFCLALTAFLFSAVILVFNKFGIVSSNFFTEYAAQIGSALEAILLSFAQASKMQSERRALFEAKKDTLKRSNQLKDEFLATISHEFRTPMNGVIGCIDLAKKADSQKEAEEALDNAHFSAKHLQHLLDNVLLYSEALSGTLKAELNPVCVQTWIKERCTPFYAIAEEKHLTFNSSTSNQLPDELNIDSLRLGQLLEHILLNAFKFTEEGNIYLSIDYEKASQRLSFIITDTGIGMSPEQTKNVFNLFSQADGSHHRKHGGLGVGTALCKLLLESMGGTIQIKSTLGSGTVVNFSISAQKVATQRSKPTKPTINPEDKTILIVEDNPVNMMVLEKYLRRDGYQVVCAENGKAGLKKVQEKTVDLILMDCQMPVMDGFEAVEKIRELPTRKSNTPIIAVTANTMSKDKEHCLEVGMNDYVPKPINSKELAIKIQHWLCVSSNKAN